MGNTMVLENEDYISSNISLLKDNLKYISSKRHQYFGQIQIWKNKANPQEWIFSKVHSDQAKQITQIDIDQNIINTQHIERKSMKHENLLKYYGCTIKEQTFQGTIKEYRVYYEFQLITLSKVLQDYKQNGQYVAESFIWKLITQISNVFGYLECQNKYHQNITLDSLFFDKEKNLKILYHGALPNILSTYAQTLGNYNSNISLTPQQMKDYQNHLACLQINPFKQDSYQFGIVLVSIMSGKDVAKCTDFYKEVIHYQQILNFLGSAFHYYSQNLINLVVSLLQYDDLSRPNISELLKAKIYKKLPFLNQKQLKKYKQPEKNTLKRMDSKISYSFQTERTDSLNNILTEHNKLTRSITNTTIIYSSPVKFSSRTSTAYPKKYSLVDGYFTPNTKQSRTISYRFFTSNKKIQSPYIQ
ncbi:unnamed protein product (macronuclear) [Paramecium tetraurelia]|uniref:Protein kinase domain-containing protein n=1 Tax=Paramecium tetraurelia TaxID=5888 RepID=A0D9P4_PARTE|nr:uncharacterized protein GSPATT00014692001 [Paramecium tetraurelia]CAK79761.1 unnamed protein product [Paramecium tetraurelia]|eukprot:XP_001447158.1 hypothetical protein (macronuclear) [Paramecium tetraurelia strain d4-2]